MGSGNFLTYQDAQPILTKIGQKFDTLSNALTFRGNTTFANLPSVLTPTMSGYVYNVTNDFTTDNRFIDGAGIPVKAGTNVTIIDLSTYAAATPVGSENPSNEGWYELVNDKYVLSSDTEVDSLKTYYVKTVVLKYDISGTFVDTTPLVNGIKDVGDMIADDFDDAVAYSNGDVVKNEGKLYKFNSDHNIGSWDLSEVDETTVEELIASAEPASLTTAQINNLLALLD